MVRKIGLAELAEPGDDLPGGPAGRRVEAGGRLVQEDDVGVADQRQGDVEAAALAAGQLGGEGVGLVGQADQGDGVVDVARRPVVAGVELQALAHRQPGSGSDSCRTTPTRSRQAPPALAGSTPRHVTSPSVRVPEAFEDLDGGGLAGAVGAEEGEDLAAVHLEVDAADRFVGAVALDEPADGHHRLVELTRSDRSRSSVAGAVHVAPRRVVDLLPSVRHTADRRLRPGGGTSARRVDSHPGWTDSTRGWTSGTPWIHPGAGDGDAARPYSFV